jgi:hypothetical protein
VLDKPFFDMGADLRMAEAAFAIVGEEYLDPAPFVHRAAGGRGDVLDGHLSRLLLEEVFDGFENVRLRYAKLGVNHMNAFIEKVFELCLVHCGEGNGFRHFFQAVLSLDVANMARADFQEIGNVLMLAPDRIPDPGAKGPEQAMMRAVPWLFDFRTQNLAERKFRQDGRTFRAERAESHAFTDQPQVSHG